MQWHYQLKLLRSCKIIVIFIVSSSKGVFVCLFVWLYVCVRNNSKSMNGSFWNFFYVCRAWPKQSDSYYGYIRSQIFKGPIFNVFSMTFVFVWYALLQKKWVYLDEIFISVGVWPNEQVWLNDGKVLDHILDTKNPESSELCPGGGVHSTSAF